jgi:tRNA (guanosine-2'-O-)-methyltransferase
MIDLEEKVLAKLYDIITPNKREMFDRIASQRTNHITLAIENVFQEHNASAVLRSCDCFGIQKLHIIEKDNAYKVQRDIALGAGRWVDQFNFNRGETPTLDCIQKLKREGYKIIATTPHTNANTIQDLPLDQPMAFIFGTERKGISEEVIENADAFVKIPMFGFTESFNISVAILLNTIRTRLSESNLDWKLSAEEQIALKIKWCTKILNGGNELEREIRKRLLENK